MKTTTMKLALVVIASGSMLFSCKKEESTSSACSINMSNIAGSYKVTALQYKLTTTATPVNYLDFMDACEKDDIIRLESNGIYDYHDAGTVCTPNGNEHGTWQLQGTTLTLNGDGALNATVVSYDCKTLIYYVENSIKEGDRMTFTLVKQ